MNKQYLELDAYGKYRDYGLYDFIQVDRLFKVLYYMNKKPISFVSLVGVVLSDFTVFNPYNNENELMEIVKFFDLKYEYNELSGKIIILNENKDALRNKKENRKKKTKGNGYEYKISRACNTDAVIYAALEKIQGHIFK